MAGYCASEHKIYVSIIGVEDADRRLSTYQIATAFGYHLQTLLTYNGTTETEGETQEQHAIRVQLQANCFAGVALTGQDAYVNPDDLLALLSTVTGGPTTSQQAAQWYRRGLNGDPSQCDPFSVQEFETL